MAVDQAVRFKSLFDCLFEYPHFLLCSRPEVPLQFSPTKIIKLDFFDKQKIFEYIDGYLSAKKLPFGNDPGFRDMIQDKIDFLPHLIDLLKVPLHCQLFCNMIFEENQKPTAATFENIIRLSLYQSLVLGKIRVYLTEKMGIIKKKFIDVEHLYVFCGKILGQIAKAAFLQIGFIEGRDSYFDIKNKNEITELALVRLERKKNVNDLERVVFRFPHRTIEEYFAALYIAKGLCKEDRRDEFYHLVKKYRYNPRYEVIWQILTSILFNGDPFIGKDTSNGLLLFCSALIDAPRDLIGHRHHSLVKSCFVNCDLNKIIDTDLRMIFQKPFVSKLEESRTPLHMGFHSVFSKPFNSHTKWVAKSNLSESQKLEAAKNKFSSVSYDLRLNDDVSNFNTAYDYFVSLKDEELIKKAMQFLFKYIKEKTFYREPNKKSMIFKDFSFIHSAHIKNKLSFALDVLSMYSPLLLDDERFICEVIFGFYRLTSNSSLLDTRLLKTLGVFTFHGEEVLIFLKQEVLSLLDSLRDSRMLISIIDCLKKSHAIDGLVIDKLKETVLLKDSITVLEALFYFLEKPDVLVFIKDSLIALIRKQGLREFDRLKKLIDKVINSFNEVQLHSLVQAVFEILENSTRHGTYLSYMPIDLIFYLLQEKKVAFDDVKEHLINCLVNVRFRNKIVEILAIFKGIDSKVVNRLLALDDHSSESCQALLSLPTEFIGDRIVVAIIKCERSALDYLKTLVEKNLDFSRLSEETKENIFSKCREYVNSTWQSEKLMFVLQYVFGIEKSLEVFINTPFSEPSPFSFSPLLGNNNLTSTPPEPVKFNSTDKYRKFKVRFEVIDKLITVNAIKYCWKSFLKEFFQENSVVKATSIEENWNFFIIFEYINKQKLAVTLQDHVLTIYTPNNIIPLNIEGDLRNGNNLEQKVKDFFSIKKRELQKEYSELDHIFMAIETRELLMPQSLIFSNLNSRGNLKHNLSNFNRNRDLTRARSNSF